MRPIELLNNLSILLRTTSTYNQFKHTQIQKQKSKIEGLSTTYLLLQFYSIGLSLISSLFYLLDPKIQSQYKTRFFGENTPINLPYSFIEIIYCGLSVVLLLQVKPRLNKELLVFILLQLIPFAYLYKLWWFNQAKIFKLDLVDYLWFLGKFNFCIYLIPQVYEIWLLENGNGLHSGWLLFNSAALAFEIGGNYVNDLEWFENPFNFGNYWIIIWCNLIWILIILIQTKYLYRHREEIVHYKEV
ncbi:hypothetical protein KGF54_005533 [Candida jiufengensis]|uniref:uncharacterized protein n=1 Tax=Candida jiufengensis TaxID=497108 RepID=UPI002224B26F|nr:uncharacterized protein KGF54_005533 [Candida jiufengensis]KAI5949298.1 hypothetical protein KGF54_005533 [Candida jiufengensis]